MSNSSSRHLGFFGNGLAYDFESQFQIFFNFVCGQTIPQNDV